MLKAIIQSEDISVVIFIHLTIGGQEKHRNPPVIDDLTTSLLLNTNQVNSKDKRR